MKQVAVILSGCGVYDGSEIHEATLTLYALAKRGINYKCFAPNIELKVIDHISGKEAGTRNVLTESARIARGEIGDLAELNATKFDAVVFPGGFGAAKNLCDFATKGADMSVDPLVEKTLKDFYGSKKFIGLMCIAPVLAARALPGVSVTIGSDSDTAKAVEAMGAQHKVCQVDEICIDDVFKVITTPAYMLAANPAQAMSGIDKLVEALVKAS